MSEESTMGNAQGWKMYNFQAMGDGGISSFCGDRLKRADAAVLSVEGPIHFMPSVITHTVEGGEFAAGIRSPKTSRSIAGIHHAQTMRDE
jgi:hypothetical protein